MGESFRFWIFQTHNPVDKERSSLRPMEAIKSVGVR